MPKFNKNQKYPSRGVKIFSTFLILFGFVQFLMIIVSFFQLRLELQLKDEMPFLFSQFPYISINSTLFWLSTIVSMLIALSWAVSGVFMLLLKDWARKLLLISMGVYIVNCVVNIYLSIFMTYEHASSVPVALLALGVVIVLCFIISVSYFFNHPDIARQFNPNTRRR